MSKKKTKKADRTKAVEQEREVAIKVLQQQLNRTDLKKKERKATQAELDALLQVRGDFTPSTAPTAGRRSSDLVPAGRTVEDLDALAERADALKQRLSTDAGPASEQQSAPSNAEQPDAYDKPDDQTEVAYQWRKKAEREQAEVNRAFLTAKRTMVDPDPFAEALQEAAEVDPNLAANIKATTSSALPFEVPEDPVLTNGQGRPTIWAPHPKEGAKLTAYTRVTTYIDCLEDKSMLDKWKQRTLLEGAYLEEMQDGSAGGSSVWAVGKSMVRRDATLANLAEREAAGDVFTVLERATAVKEHRDFTNRIVENLMDIGGQHDKADTGTRLHRITELVDDGQPIPDWATKSDRLDVEAYLKAKEAAGLEVLWTERRVVDDVLGITGTMDRAYLAKLPGRTRRVRVVGDLKTGNVEWGAGKIGMQLAAYANGKGYTHDREHLEREDLRLSKTDALLIHLPAGEHRCSIYLVDLTLASKGLDLARQVRAWRNEGKRVYDLKHALTSAEAAPAVDA